MTTPHNYITLGCDCSPAAALQTLELREQALPFDWVVSNIHVLDMCFKERFQRYHTGLQYNHTRLVDVYGFQFPHDYPTNDASGTAVGEGTNPEAIITPEWSTYYNTVKAKYERRIERFLTIMADPKPVIVLCRYSMEGVKHLKTMLSVYFQKTNVFFVNSTSDPNDPMFPWIYNCNTEINGAWNQSEIWKAGIDIAKTKCV